MPALEAAQREEMIKRNFGWMKVIGLMTGMLSGLHINSWAGDWVVDRVEARNFAESYTISRYSTGGQQIAPAVHQVGCIINEYRWPAAGITNVSPNGYDQVRYANNDFIASADAASSARHGAFGTTQTLPEISVRMIVTPIYKWVGPGEPTKEFYVRERGQVSAVDSLEDYPNPYSETNPYLGQLQILKADNGFKDPLGPWPNNGTVTNSYGTTSSYGLEANQWHITKVESDGQMVESNGQIEVPGVSRVLNGKLGSSAIPLGGLFHVHHPSYSKTVRVYYEAQVCQFTLGVDVGSKLIKDSSKHPRDRMLESYALRNRTNQQDDVSLPTRFFWDGFTNYKADVSDRVLAVIGTPNYEWKNEYTAPEGGTFESGIALHSEVTGESNTPEDLSWESTASKRFHHDLGSINNKDFATWSKDTLTRVKVKGSTPGTGELTAKARIRWYQEPVTRVRTENYVVVYDYDAGTTQTYDSIDQLLQGTSEEAQINEFITDIENAYRETIETGADAVGAALEVQMAVGSWYVPDQNDGYLYVAGKAKKIFKIGRNLARFTEIVTSVGAKLSAKSARILNAVKTARGHDNIVIEFRQRLIAETRGGKLPEDGIRSSEVADHADYQKVELDDQQVHRVGSGSGACFVAGTLIATRDGYKAIEQIKQNDLVWSREESSGKTELKKVAQTFQRQVPSTLALTFSNGERVETTVEHPFYVEHKGFVNAGLLAVGNSIVTRAGPSLSVAAIKVRSTPATVYNFEVEDFHTYFVGNSELWVHNTCAYWDGAYWRNPDGTFAASPVINRTAGADPTLDKAEVLMNGSSFKINSGHGFNRPHTGPGGVITDLRTSGLTMDQVEQEILKNLSNAVKTGAGPSAGAGPIVRQVTVGGKNIEYRVVQYASGQYAVGTYYLV